MRASMVTLLAALAVAGCSTGKPTEEAAPAAVALDGRCNADFAQFTVGKPASADLLEQARAKSGAQVARILKPHDMITLEYRSDRLNLNADEAGKVVRVNCG